MYYSQKRKDERLNKCISKVFKDMLNIYITMAALVSALDTQTNIQYGENNHIEYKWSNVQQEKILQLSFQLVRTSDENRKMELANKFMECFKEGDVENKKLMLKLLAHTRDIESGKGEYSIPYVILKELYKYDNTLGVNVLKIFVGLESNEKPIGSWKDVKYFLNELSAAPVEIMKIVNSQLRVDNDNMKLNKNCSLVAKWIPREKSSKFGWINKELAKDYFEDYGSSENGWCDSAVRKAKTHYRKLVSSINKYIDTTQIKQCSSSWGSINFDKVTSITMMKQKGAFLNNKKKESVDRINCQENMLKDLQDVKDGKSEVKGKKTSMIDFIKQALIVKDPDERFYINESWKNNGKDTKSLDNMIAMVDTSGSMEMTEKGNPLYSAMGLGIRISEKSKLGKRVMTFNSRPEWVNLEECKDFVDEVIKVRDAGWGMNTDFHKAMDMILDVIIKNKIPAEDVENIVLTVLSDMQFDSAPTKSSPYNSSVRQILSDKFHEAGMRVCGKGYKVPHILFWNLRSSNGFPELSYQENVTMLSGYSPMLLNSFIEVGMTALKELTPWNMLVKMLEKERYNEIGDLL